MTSVLLERSNVNARAWPPQSSARCAPVPSAGATL